MICTSKPIQVTVFAYSTVVFINLTRHNSIITWDCNISYNFLLAKNLYSLLRAFSCRGGWNNVQSSAISEHFLKIIYQIWTEITEINEQKDSKQLLGKYFTFFSQGKHHLISCRLPYTLQNIEAVIHIYSTEQLF